jgi:Mg-chelatase subunit ChlD
MYGLTPMCYALKMALETFRSKPEAKYCVLVLVLDGLLTDGDLILAASEL